MNSLFWIAQIIGLLGFILLVVSYFRKNTNQILILQIICCICYCVHYLLLGAASGFFICFFEMLRDYAYFKSDNDKKVFLFTIPIYVVFGLVNFRVLLDVLPVLPSISDGYFLTKSKKYVIIGSIVSHLLWITYDFSYKSYSGVITCVIILVSNIFILLFDKSLTKKDLNTHIDGFERK